MTLFQDYWEILSDPAHTLVELTFTFVIDIVALGLLWPFVAKKIQREHADIDFEHGLINHQKPPSNVTIINRDRHPTAYYSDENDPFVG